MLTVRNRNAGQIYTSLMIELADEVVIGYASPDGNLERLLGKIGDKKVESLAKTSAAHGT